MGVSKADVFSEELNQMANLFKAISHPARIAIIQYLLEVDHCICGDIVNELPLAQPTVSQHLKELKNVNIIQGTIEGKSICYCLNPRTIQKMQTYFKNIEIQLQNNCC